MKKFANRIILVVLMLALSLSMNSATAEEYVIDKAIDDNWHIFCDLGQPDGFGTEIYQYAYTQKKASDEVDQMVSAPLLFQLLLPARA